jgi:hypothetical protein
MTVEAAMQGATAEVGDGVPQAAQHVVQRQQCFLPERHHNGFLGRRQYRAPGRLGPIGASVVVVRLRHFFTVFWFGQCRAVVWGV